jgi:hypothetical protein
MCADFACGTIDVMRERIFVPSLDKKTEFLS